MAWSTTVFVEGASDQHFINCLLKDIGLDDSVETAIIGGSVNELKNVLPQIMRKIDAGRGIAIIVDANSDPVSRRDELIKELARLGVQDKGTFMLPNNHMEGCLEVLLEQVAGAEHRVVFSCFDNYKECLERHNGSYELPNDKAKIYAYCEAVRTEPKPKERKYCDPDFWDLGAVVLEPLKDFLKEVAR